MDKIAQLKHAEVAGVISGLIDGGYLKLASDQEFEALTDVVAGSVSDQWDLNEVLNKTAEVVSYVEDGGVEKTAEEEFVDSALAQYGYLCLAKEAEKISDEDFLKESANVKASIGQVLKDAFTAKQLRNVPWRKIVSGHNTMSGGKKIKKGLEQAGLSQAGEYKDALKMIREGKKMRNKELVTAGKAMVAPALAYGGTGAALAGAGYGGYKALKKESSDASDLIDRISFISAAL